MKLAQVKDIIANNDMDIAVCRKEYATIDSWLRDMGHFVSLTQVERAVNELQDDPYFARMKKDLSLC